MDRTSTRGVCDRLLADDPDAIVVHHDLRGLTEGIVRRDVRWATAESSAPAESSTVLELAHGCVSCTLREDVLPLLRRLAGRGEVRRIVLHLDPVLEPEPVCWALANVVVGEGTVTDVLDVEAVTAVVDEGTWLADATGDGDLSECHGRDFAVTPDEDRTLAQVAVGQVAFADALVITGRADDGWDAVRLAAVLDRLAPGAPRATFGDDLPSVLQAVPVSARRGVIDDPHAPLLRGTPPLGADAGVALTLFADPRPFHPERLHDAMDVLFDGVVHTRGRAWVASQPDVALWVESAGGSLRIGHAGGWLAGADDAEWDRVDAQRRAKAALDWHPRFGDRTQELLILTHQVSPEAITDALRGALLTDAELAEGEDAWRGYADPFGAWHTDPCDDFESTDTTTADSRKDQA
nr:GTP-binding protein [Prauserella isguenensis]